MRTITLDERATPESAEAALWQAAQGTDHIVVRMHGFPAEELAVIVGRLQGWTATRAGAIVSLTRNVAAPVEGATAGAADVAPRSVRGDRHSRVTVATANIMSNPLMSAEKATHDIQRVARTGGVILWQEVQPYLAIIRHLAGYETYVHPGLGNIAISYPSRYKLVDAGGEIVTPGRSRHDPKHPGAPTPNRGYAWVKLLDPTTGRTFTVVNDHAINKAWNGRELDRGALTTRRGDWTEELRALGDFLATVDGPLIGGGDQNAEAGRVRRALRRVARVDTTSGIDHLYHAGGARPTDRVIQAIRNLFSDHDTRVQTYAV